MTKDMEDARQSFGSTVPSIADELGNGAELALASLAEKGKEPENNGNDDIELNPSGANSAHMDDRAEDSAEEEKARGLCTKRKVQSQNPKRGRAAGSRGVIEEDTKKSNWKNPMIVPPLDSSPMRQQASPGTKRSHRGDSPEPTPEDLARMSRSERKRHREKKRRSDVNKGFDDLMALLVQIDPSIKAEAEERARKNQNRSSGGSTDIDSSLLINRVELISRAVTVLERIHRENEERKLLINELTSRLGGGGGGGGGGSSSINDDQVMMMVPTLAPVDSMMQAAARGGLGLSPQYNLLPSSLAQVRLANQAAAFPPGQFLGFGSHALMQSMAGAGGQSDIGLSGAPSASTSHRSEKRDRSSDEQPEPKRQRDYQRRW